jgi:hypothetical protein
MRKVHPVEMELACWDDGEASAGVVGHVRWCARCRSAVADYRWLAGEIGATFAAVADAVDVPRPQWWAVHGRLLASQRRWVAGGRASAVASVVSVVCLMLWLSPVLPPALGTAVALRTPPPEAMVVSAPVTAPVSGTGALGATPTPIVSRADATLAPTPDFALPPTPPEPET